MAEDKLLLDGLRLLLVDDNADMLELLLVLFNIAGAEVKTADSLATALEILEDYNPDVLISDLILADGDGLTLVREAKQRYRVKNQKIIAIALTAYSGSEMQYITRLAGYELHQKC